MPRFFRPKTGPKKVVLFPRYYLYAHVSSPTYILTLEPELFQFFRDLSPKTSIFFAIEYENFQNFPYKLKVDFSSLIFWASIPVFFGKNCITVTFLFFDILELLYKIFQKLIIILISAHRSGVLKSILHTFSGLPGTL